MATLTTEATIMAAMVIILHPHLHGQIGIPVQLALPCNKPGGLRVQLLQLRLRLQLRLLLQLQPLQRPLQDH